MTGPVATTLGDLVRVVQRRLEAAAVEDAGREARRLVVAAGGVAPEALITRPQEAVGAALANRIEEALGRRLVGEPIGRIVGYRDFFGRAFKLNAATLEPRADSEVVIEAVLEVAGRQWGLDAPLRIVDVGTGSGCLLVTLLAELPAATGVGIDIAPAAVEAARANAVGHGVSERARFVVADVLDGVEEAFDILVSNPPYIRRDEIGELSDEVRLFDPHLALDGGPTGLDLYDRIARRMMGVVPDGWMFVEIGAGMRDAVEGVFDRQLGATADWLVWRDLNGHERCVARQSRLPKQHE